MIDKHKTRKPNDVRIGYTYFDQRHMFWVMQARAVGGRAAELGAELLLFPAATIPEQVQAIEDMLNQNLDALIVGPVDGTHSDIVQAVKEVVSTGIPVISTNQEIQDVEITSTVRSDNLKGGQLAAEYVIDQLEGKGQIILIDSPYPSLRVEGFRQVIGRHPNADIVFAKAGDWKRASGAEIMREGLSDCPDAQAIFAVNDPMTLGALDVLVEVGRDGKFIIVGYDGLAQTFKGIHEGQIHATVTQTPQEMGHVAVDLAVSALPGEAVSATVLTEVNLISKENLTDQLVDTLPNIFLGLIDSYETQQHYQQKAIKAQQEILEVQKQVIHDLSTPVIPIMDQIILMPLVGSVDSLRARDITRSLLAGINRHRAKVVILDVTGVDIMDTGIVNHLNKTIQTAQLKGAKTIVTGISDAVAESIVDLGIDWSEITTLSNLQTGLMVALRSLGVKLSQ